MPIVTSRQDTSATSPQNDNYRAPHRTLVANTKSIKDMVTAPGAAGEPSTTELDPIKKDVIQAVTKDPNEIGQLETTEEVTKEPAVTLSPQLTALARKEQAFRKQEQAFKTKEQEFKATQAAFEAKQAEYAGYAKLKEALTADDYSVLDELGVSYEKWTNYLLNKGDSTTPEKQEFKAIKDELKAIKTQQEERDKKQKESVDKQYEATVNQYKKEIQSLVETDPNFESVKELKAEEHVLQHILDTFNEDGDVLTVEEAAKDIEDALVEEALAMSKLKKIQAKIQPDTKADTKTLPPPKPGIKTLTQQVAPQAVKTYGQFQHLSPKERIAQAIAKSQR